MQIIYIKGTIEKKLPLVNKPNIEVLPVAIRDGDPALRHNIYKIDFINERIKMVYPFDVGCDVVVEVAMKGMEKNGIHFINLEALSIIKQTKSL